ncbi:8-amino-7-oxononanoate synthase [Candidatus Marinamargulisbacteria bacterium SCGC AG-439-L15]|nr:8-amino-7-oxononanoate synthase [Candidatus Marinamargulisbacteria bacterium SCGC AG-439-L15]
MDSFRTLNPIDSRRGVHIIREGNTYIDFSSNDYLGLSQDPRLIQAAVTACEQQGTGSTGSRLLSGDSTQIHELEKNIANFKQKPAALLFNSGLQMNTGLFSTLYGPKDLILLDKYAHASLIDGVRASGAQWHRFRHNDTQHLVQLLDKYRSLFNRCAIITESVFSMDGDSAPIHEIADIKTHYECEFWVDDAHSTGVFGATGSGLIEEWGLADKVDGILGTFGKALASFGAYCACSPEIKDFLISRCRHFIYTTALPPAVIATNLKSLDLVQDATDKRKHLADLIQLANGESHIIPVIVGKISDTHTLAQKVQSSGYWVSTIKAPTVPKNQARLRLSLTSDHTKKELTSLLSLLNTANVVN